MQASDSNGLVADAAPEAVFRARRSDEKSNNAVDAEIPEAVFRRGSEIGDEVFDVAVPESVF